MSPLLSLNKGDFLLFARMFKCVAFVSFQSFSFPACLAVIVVVLNWCPENGGNSAEKYPHLGVS